MIEEKIKLHIKTNEEKIQQWNEALSYIDKIKQQEKIDKKDIEFLLNNADKLGGIMIAHLESEIEKLKIDLERLRVIEEVEKDLMQKL